ncbi:MAG TPA: tetratricopeptide repeat protein [Gemmatimonadaceae bacterium]|nr:tetratricopeptide repeat protein [Gemmatimonadaceae bacterium]
MTPAAAATASRPTLEERTESLQEWARLYTRELSIAGVILVALIGVLWLYRYSSRQQLQRADAQLASPLRSLAAGNVPLAQTDLKRIITRFGGTPAATQASMILAETYYAQGKYIDGLSTLQTAPRSGASAPFAPGVEALIGDGYSEEAKYQDAATHYLAAASASPFPNDQAHFKANAARAYTNAADTAHAVAIWRELAKNDATPQAAEAHLRLGELTVHAAK